ncbi:metalloregulator ArsR/SmtB family transcription factor [Bacillus cereus group sp. BfR-BA-01318]|uniref:ArsR/SmtB family transcription factor n=1 Tax=unclassified Bacillus cereus group TaxID=2750818 RepID=UPI001298CD83|nr:metalloregulator ArsR/SmtB family transcription factor [Bacillus cereus group sp. BfR-BA-01318]MEB9419899.1 metalloregulator ArsR/SmtB family transcription factor [Bacillus cereus]MRD20725.1 metalloregulator ArsR/SmtB family transcription factor [Bacillus thuringiensis]
MNTLLAAKYTNLEEDVELLKVLSHPVRLRIVAELINNKSLNVTQLIHLLDAPQSTVSQHLTKLKSARVVKFERSGIEVHYRMNNDKASKLVHLLLED